MRSLLSHLFGGPSVVKSDRDPGSDGLVRMEDGAL